MERILYFTTDFSDKNQAFAKEYGLLIRNAGAYGVIDFVERCDMVFGEIPKAYEHLPKFELQKSKQEPKRKTKQPKLNEQE